jgi:hypothetical protein
VVRRERRREADRAGGHRAAHLRDHRGELGGRGLGAARGGLAHHRGADRRVAGEHRDVQRRPEPAQQRQVFGEGLELPPRAGPQRAEVHALDDRQVAQHRVAQRRRARRDAEAAVADHRGGHAERRATASSPGPR